MYGMCPPLLLLDVDGVLSLFGFDARRPPAGRYLLVDGHLHYLSAVATDLLEPLALLYELVWCTGWEDRADAHLPAALGVPSGLPHLRFVDDRADQRRLLRHWKLDAIDAFAGADRALAWIDDEHDESCARWAAQRPGPTLLVATDPAVGLAADHVRELTAWARGRSGS
jgi:hypothetical protein